MNLSQDLIDCKLHIQDDNESKYIFFDSEMKLTIYICKIIDMTPKKLQLKHNLELYTTMCTQDINTSNINTLYTSYPSNFDNTGQAIAIIRINDFKQNISEMEYQIKCDCKSNNVNVIKPCYSTKFKLVKYKLCISSYAGLCDEYKWYKDEGGKHNYFQVVICLKDKTNQIINDNIHFKCLLLYNDYQEVQNQEILLLNNRNKDNINIQDGKVILYCKLLAVSSHHQNKVKKEK